VHFRSLGTEQLILVPVVVVYRASGANGGFKVARGLRVRPRVGGLAEDGLGVLQSAYGFTGTVFFGITPSAAEINATMGSAVDS